DLGEDVAHGSGCIRHFASFDTRRRFASTRLRMRWVVDGTKETASSPACAGAGSERSRSEQSKDAASRSSIHELVIVMSLSSTWRAAPVSIDMAAITAPSRKLSALPATSSEAALVHSTMS